MDGCTYTYNGHSDSDEEYEKLSTNINSKPFATIKQEPKDVNLDTEELSNIWIKNSKNDDKLVFKAGHDNGYNKQVSIKLEDFKAGVSYDDIHGEKNRSEFLFEEKNIKYKYTDGENIKVHKVNMSEGNHSRIAEVKLELDNSEKLQRGFITRAKTELQSLSFYDILGRAKIKNEILDSVDSDDEYGEGKKLMKEVDDYDNLRNKSGNHNHNAYINKKYVRNNPNASSRVFQCKFCQYETKYKYLLVHHFKLKHDETAEWFQCEFCEYKTKEKRLLKRHVDTKHNNSWVQCSFCEYRSKSKWSLKQHLRLKHNSSLESLKCDFCEYRTKSKWGLKKHVNCKHLKDHHNWKQCQFCEHKARDKFNLRTHIKHKHHGWFHCPSCPRGAKSILLLENHIKNVHRTVLDFSTVRLVNIEESLVDSAVEENVA